MKQLFVLFCVVLSVLSACHDKFMRNGASCYSGNNCAFGCHNGKCWSQCDGMYPLFYFSRPTSFLQKSSCRLSSEKNILNSSVEWSGKIG